MDTRQRVFWAEAPADEPPMTSDRDLKALFACARELIDALEQGTQGPALAARIRSYAACAAAQGVSPARIRAALEYLLEEHSAATRTRRTA
jgi:hypothetical protein